MSNTGSSTRPVVVQPDARGRVALRQILSHRNRARVYLATVADDGTITLRPAEVVLAAEQETK